MGCDYFDDSDEMANPVVDSTPVVIPVDADWELVATLQRNPLRPAEFYIFPEQAALINAAYREGRHFIFELGGENIGRQVKQIRHYMIQPEPPFQDKHKDALHLTNEQQTGVKFDNHYYVFSSEGWYESVANLVGQKAIGLGVEFSLTHFEPRGQFAGEGTIHSTKMGLIDRLDSSIIGRGA